MRHILPGLFVGLLFGAGLALSGMINPARVLGFLDVAGAWDPTLAIVFAGALLPSTLSYAIVRRMKRPVMADEFCIPQNRTIERRLLAGAAMFGIGWGLVGLCPGPAIAGMVLGKWEVWLFVVAMIAGMWLQRLYADLRDRGTLQFAG
jgi:uncharacterized membrane protein YedE/YeeE